MTGTSPQLPSQPPPFQLYFETLLLLSGHKLQIHKASFHLSTPRDTQDLTSHYACQTLPRPVQSQPPQKFSSHQLSTSSPSSFGTAEVTEKTQWRSRCLSLADLQQFRGASRSAILTVKIHAFTVEHPRFCVSHLYLMCHPPLHNSGGEDLRPPLHNNTLPAHSASSINPHLAVSQFAGTGVRRAYQPITSSFNPSQILQKSCRKRPPLAGG